MKKTIMTIGCLAILLLSGCQTKTPEATAIPSATTSQNQDLTVYDDYANAFRSRMTSDSYTLGARGNYTFSFSDHTTQYYDIDSVLQLEYNDNDARAHLRQHIDSDGIVIDTDGYYYNGRLYNRYQNILYYEDMSVSQLKAALQIPCDPLQVERSAVESVEVSESDEGTSYVLHLSPDGAKRLYLSRYDLYGLNEYSGFSVDEGTITQRFKDGILTEDKAEFIGCVKINGEEVQVFYASSVGYLSLDSTVVTIPQMDESAFVSYSDIDVDAISDADINDDRVEDTIEKTVRKRLVNRLGYTQVSADIYKTEFNEGESYTIDFGSKQFIYENHTSLYTYNWQGNTGGFGSSCSYNYSTGTGSSNCQESVLEKMPDIKLYFELELYYCGYSLEELQKESNETH